MTGSSSSLFIWRETPCWRGCRLFSDQFLSTFRWSWWVSVHSEEETGDCQWSTSSPALGSSAWRSNQWFSFIFRASCFQTWFDSRLLLFRFGSIRRSSHSLFPTRGLMTTTFRAMWVSSPSLHCLFVIDTHPSESFQYSGNEKTLGIYFFSFYFDLCCFLARNHPGSLYKWYRRGIHFGVFFLYVYQEIQVITKDLPIILKILDWFTKSQALCIFLIIYFQNWKTKAKCFYWNQIGKYLLKQKMSNWRKK